MAALGRRRVVVTGLGLVTPLGVGVGHVWGRLTAADCALARCSRVPDERLGKLPCQVTAEVPHGTGEGEFDMAEWVRPEIRRHTLPFVHYALCAAQQALEDAGWTAAEQGREASERAGVAVGCGMVDIATIGKTYETLQNRGYRKLSPFFVPSILGNLAAGHVSMTHDLRGPNHSASTACATGAHSLGDAYRCIAFDDCTDMMVAGGTEAALDELAMAGFSRAQALATGYNDDPASASRPFDKDRTGFVMGEGAGCVVLEELESAKRRGASIYAEVVGYGMSADAHHITQPAPGGDGAARAMRNALRSAGVHPDEVGYVNAHATSTPMGDEMEARALCSVFGARAVAGELPISSTKGAVGHLLGAAGAVESIFSILALHHAVLPPTLNLHALDDSVKEFAPNIDLVPLQARGLAPGKLTHVMSNSFGFGGTNASLVFKAPADS